MANLTVSDRAYKRRDYVLVLNNHTVVGNHAVVVTVKQNSINSHSSTRIPPGRCRLHVYFDYLQGYFIPAAEPPIRSADPT